MDAMQFVISAKAEIQSGWTALGYEIQKVSLCL